jgi:hypothetical protein
MTAWECPPSLPDLGIHTCFTKANTTDGARDETFKVVAHAGTALHQSDPDAEIFVHVVPWY